MQEYPVGDTLELEPGQLAQFIATSGPRAARATLHGDNNTKPDRHPANLA